jgi:hypothetical protein
MAAGPLAFGHSVGVAVEELNSVALFGCCGGVRGRNAPGISGSKT